MLLRSVVTNIDKICPVIKICEKICFEKDLNQNWVDKLGIGITKPKYTYETDNILTKDFKNIENKLNWITPSHLCNKYVTDMVELGGNQYGMKTALLVGNKDFGALLHNDDIEVGYAYFKSNWFYPLHCHKTEELYHILHGTATFGKEEENGVIYKSVKDGDTIYHKSYQPHAMIFRDEPVLSIYIWYRKGKYYFIK